MKNYSILIVFLGLTFFFSQGFQCASPDMTAAKIAYKNKDYPKAIEYLNKELAKNPSNEEAYRMMLEIRYNQKEYLAAVDVAKSSDKVVKTPENKNMISQLKYLVWRNGIYIDAYSYYEKYLKSKSVQHADTAILLANAGIGMRPEILDFYFIKASLYEMMGDTAKSIEENLNYVKMAKKEIEFNKQYGIYLGMPREQVFEKLGKPASANADKQENGDSVAIDIYKLDNREIYIFYTNSVRASGDKQTQESFNPMRTIGFRVDLPTDWLPKEKETMIPFSTAPLTTLAFYYYNNKKQSEKALEYIKTWLSFEPSNKEANNSLIIIYNELGKTEEALKFVEEQSKKEPNNPIYLAQRGDLLFSMKKWDEAIQQYEAALKLNPNYWIVYRNCASTYKNKAVQIQQSIQDKLDKDPKFKYDPNEFSPLLKKSAEYFELCLNDDEYKNDFLVYGELANIYEVLDNKEKLKAMLEKLESLELNIDQDAQLETYYLNLIRIYSNLKETKKLEETQNKLKALKGE